MNVQVEMMGRTRYVGEETFLCSFQLPFFSFTHKFFTAFGFVSFRFMGASFIGMFDTSLAC